MAAVADWRNRDIGPRQGYGRSATQGRRGSGPRKCNTAAGTRGVGRGAPVPLRVKPRSRRGRAGKTDARLLTPRKERLVPVTMRLLRYASDAVTPLTPWCPTAKGRAQARRKCNTSGRATPPLGRVATGGGAPVALQHEATLGHRHAGQARALKLAPNGVPVRRKETMYAAHVRRPESPFCL